MSTEDKTPTKRDYGVNAFRGLLKAIPYAGPSLEQFIFGSLEQLRWRRVESMLTEVAQALGKIRAPAMANEPFVTLLESIAPDLSRTLNEDKQARFRDLLMNAATLDPQSNKWEEAFFASRLLKEIDGPGLCLLAIIHNAHQAKSFTIASVPVSQVYEGELDYDNPGDPDHILPYEWPIVDFWARRLSEQGLIWYQSIGGSGGRGGFNGVSLSKRGDFLIQWILHE